LNFKASQSTSVLTVMAEGHSMLLRLTLTLISVAGFVRHMRSSSIEEAAKGCHRVMARVARACEMLVWAGPAASDYGGRVRVCGGDARIVAERPAAEIAGDAADLLPSAGVAGARCRCARR
jgi:hypothetical protein